MTEHDVYHLRVTYSVALFDALPSGGADTDGEPLGRCSCGALLRLYVTRRDDTQEDPPHLTRHQLRRYDSREADDLPEDGPYTDWPGYTDAPY